MKRSVEFPRMRLIVIAMLIVLALAIVPGLIISSSHGQEKQDDAAARKRVGEPPQGEEKEGDPRDREKFWEMRRAGITAAQIAAARKQAERLPQATSLPRKSANTSIQGKSGVEMNAVTPGGSPWISFGPAPISSGSATYSGRVPTLAADPVDPNTIYAGGANGGVWKSTNGGNSWIAMNGESTMPTLAMGSIAIDPNNRNTIYAGTGEPNGSYDSHFGRGVLKTTDAGATWTIVGDGDPFPIGLTTTYRVIVSPSGVLWVASNQGLHRSTSGGLTWKRTKPGTGFADGFVRDVAMSSDGNIMYAVVSFNSNSSLNGLYRSQDAGSSWTHITSGLGGIGWSSRSRLAIARSNPNVGYLIVDPVVGFAYFTTNGGSSWSPMTSFNPGPTYGGYSMEIAVDPLSANTVYVLGFNVWVNTGGTTGGGWTEILQLHEDQHAISFLPCSVSPCPYYLGNDGGVYQVWPQGSATNVSIQSKNTNLAITEFTGGDLGINFVNDPRAIGGSQDNGTEVFVPSATSNPVEWIKSLGADGGYAYLDHNSDTPYIAYGEQQAACGPFQSNICSFYKSDYWGYSWNLFMSGLENLPAAFYPFYVPDRTNRFHLALAANHSVYENSTANAAWYRSSQDLGAPPLAIGIAPTNSAIIYAGLPGAQYQLPGVVYRTASGNSGGQSNWVLRSGSETATLPSDLSVSSIAVDSTNADTVYICGSRSSGQPVYKTTDGGQHWANISGNLPASLPAFSIITYFAGPTRVIVIGTDAGVYFTTNEGQSWSALNSGLPNTRIAQLAIDRDQTTIAAFTAGRGAFSTNIGDGTVCTYAINPSSQNFTASGGSGTFNVSTTSGCGWMAQSDSTSWLTTSSSGSGSGPVNFAVAMNSTSSSRVGHITVQNQTFTVTQAGTAANQPPVANPGGPYSGTVGVAVQFNGSGSSDPEGLPLTYLWNFGDGASGSGAMPTHVYTTATTYSVLLTVTDSGGLQNSASTTAFITNGGGGSGLVGYWKFDEGVGTIAADSSGLGNAGTLTNGPGWVTGQINSAVNFDGANDYVQVGNRASLIMSTGLTMSAWIKPTSNTSGPHTIMNKEGEYEVSFYDGQIAWAISNNSPGWAWAFTGYYPPVNTWTHIAVTYDGSTIRTYANGALVNSQPGSGNIFDSYTPENDFRIGSRQCGICTEYFSGGIDEVRMHNRALSAAEIQALIPPSGNGPVGYWKFDEGSGTSAADTSGNGNTGTLTNGPVWISGQVNSAINFDGSNDYVQVGDRTSLIVSSGLTMSAWIKPTSNTSGFHTILNREGEYEVSVVNGQIGWAIANSSPGWNWVYTGYVPPVNTWTHIAVTYDGSTIKTYANAVLVHSYNGAGTITDTSPAENDFRIGSRQCSACVEYFTGGIDEVRVYSRGLSAAEIQALIPPSGPVPVGYWKFDEGSGTLAADSSGNGLNGSLTNGPTWMAGRVNSAINFDGVNDYVQVGSQPALLMTNTLTLSAWIYPTSANSTRTIVNREGEYNIGELAGVLSWAFSNTNPGWNWVSTGYSPPLFQWTHIAVTYNNGIVKTYANGVLVHTYNGSGAIVDSSPPENDFRIGSRQCSFCAEYFSGGIDEVRMYNTELSAADIQTLANPGGQPMIGTNYLGHNELVDLLFGRQAGTNLFARLVSP